MPYILKKDRIKLEDALQKIIPENAGEINYCIFKIALNYIKSKGLSYQTLNDLEGALSNCSKEIYRRISTHYEDLKIVENGDIDGASELLDGIIDSMLAKFNKK